MLNPRLRDCKEYNTIPSLIKAIDCKISKIATALYNNTIFSLNISIDSDTMLSLLNYRRILLYKYCNSEYAKRIELDKIISKVKLLTAGCKPKCLPKDSFHRGTITTTTAIPTYMTYIVNVFSCNGEDACGTVVATNVRYTNLASNQILTNGNFYKYINVFEIILCLGVLTPEENTFYIWEGGETSCSAFNFHCTTTTTTTAPSTTTTTTTTAPSTTTTTTTTAPSTTTTTTTAPSTTTTTTTTAPSTTTTTTTAPSTTTTTTTAPSTTTTTTTTAPSTTTTTTTAPSTTTTTTSTTTTSTTSTTTTQGSSTSSTTSTTTTLPPIVQEYGYLYNWYAGTDAKNIANVGWHNLTVADMVNLRLYLDPTGTAYTNVAGGHMKSSGTTYWNSPNTGADNSSKLDFRGSGDRDQVGNFALNKGSCWIWNTQDLGGELGGGIATLANNSANFITESGYTSSSKRVGASIRLKKDTTTSQPDFTIIPNGYTGNDGQVYDTVVINGYEWLQENIKETKYRNGDAIPEVLNNTSWSALSTGAMCYYVI